MGFASSFVIFIEGGLKVIIAIKHPRIGSGKIKRRVVISTSLPVHKKSKKKKLDEIIDKKAKSTTFIMPESRRVKDPIEFPSAYARICFNYWNASGFPFTRHRLEKNKETKRGLMLLQMAINKDGKEKVIKAIDVAKEVFNSTWFKHRFISKQKIALSNFLKYKQEHYSKYMKQHGIPLSWYKECQKGLDYMRQEYSMIIRDKYPNITKQLIKVWEVYSGQKNGLSVEDKNSLILCSKTCVKFSGKNNMGVDYLIERIDDMLNQFRTYKPAHIGYMINKYFWNNTLPREIERYDHVSKGRAWVRVM